MPLDRCQAFQVLEAVKNCQLLLFSYLDAIIFEEALLVITLNKQPIWVARHLLVNLADLGMFRSRFQVDRRSLLIAISLVLLLLAHVTPHDYFAIIFRKRTITSRYLARCLHHKADA